MRTEWDSRQRGEMIRQRNADRAKVELIGQEQREQNKGRVHRAKGELIVTQSDLPSLSRNESKELYMCHGEDRTVSCTDGSFILMTFNGNAHITVKRDFHGINMLELE